MTGMRRGEVVGLRWGDVDFSARTVAIRRSVVLIKAKGEGQRLLLKPPKSGRARVVDLDERTLRALQTHRSELAGVSLALAHADAFVFGRLTGDALQPERLSRSFNEHHRCAVNRYGLVLPDIRLHDLRHTHATLYLTEGIHPKIVNERLGHANVSITLDVY
jgi:integrase